MDKKYYLNMTTNLSDSKGSAWIGSDWKDEPDNDYTFWYPSESYYYDYSWYQSDKTSNTQEIIDGVLKGIKEMVLEITKEQVKKIEQARKIIFQKAPNCPECGADTRELEWNSSFFVCNYCEAKIYPVVKD